MIGKTIDTDIRLFLAVVLAVGLGVVSSQPVKAAQVVEMYIDADLTTPNIQNALTVNQTVTSFDVEVWIDQDSNADGINGIDLFLLYDPAKIQVTALTVGGDCPLDTPMGSSINNTAGIAAYSRAKIFSPFPTANFTLVKVTFQPQIAFLAAPGATANITYRTTGGFPTEVRDGSGASAVIGGGFHTALITSDTHGVTLTVTGIDSPIIAGTASNVTVTAWQDGAINENYTGTVNLTSNDPAAEFPAEMPYTFQPGDSGNVTFTGLIFKTAGTTQTVTATDTTVAAIRGTSANIEVRPAVTFTVMGTSNTTAIGSQVAGTAFTITVTAIKEGDVLTTYNGTIEFTTTDPHAEVVLPADYTFESGDNGQQTFINGVTLKTAGIQTVTATDNASAWVTGTSANITVTPKAASILTVFGISDPIVAGVTSDVTVNATDEFGNTDTNYRGTIAFNSSDGAAALPTANLTFSASDNGTKTFSNEVILETAGEQTVTATDTVITGIQAAITVQPATADNLRVTGDATMTAGGSNELTVTAYDQFGNVCDSGPNVYDGSQSLTFSGPGSVGGNTPTVKGTAIGTPTALTFTTGATAENATTLIAYKAETTTIDVVDANVTTINSTVNAAYDLDLVVNLDIANKLAYQVQPSSTDNVDVAFTIQPVVEIQDQWGNLRSADILTVTLADVLTSDNDTGGAGALTGTSSKAAANGVAAFTGVGYTGVDTIHIKATTGSLTAAISAVDITLDPGAATQLAFSTPPETSVVELAEWADFMVEIRDQYSNVVTTATDNVTVKAYQGTTLRALGGTTEKAPVSGVATFNNISYAAATPVTPLTVKATYLTLTVTADDTVSVTPVITANITLGEGWNIFSTPFALRENYRTWYQIQAQFGALATDNDSEMWTYDASETLPWQQVIAEDIATDTVLRPLDAYYVKMASTDNVALIADTEMFVTDSLRQKTLPAGWNLVGLGYAYGYLTTEPTGADVDGMDVKNALASVEYIGGDTSVQGYAFVRSPGFDNNDTNWLYRWGETAHIKAEDFMFTGKGYWVFMEAEDIYSAWTQTPLP